MINQKGCEAKQIKKLVKLQNAEESISKQIKLQKMEKRESQSIREMAQLDEHITTSLNDEGFQFDKKDAQTGFEREDMLDSRKAAYKQKKVRHSYQQNLAIMNSRLSGSKTPPKSINLKQFDLNIEDKYQGYSLINNETLRSSKGVKIGLAGVGYNSTRAENIAYEDSVKQLNINIQKPYGYQDQTELNSYVETNNNDESKEEFNAQFSNFISEKPSVEGVNKITENEYEDEPQRSPLQIGASTETNLRSVSVQPETTQLKKDDSKDCKSRIKMKDNSVFQLHPPSYYIPLLQLVDVGQVRDDSRYHTSSNDGVADPKKDTSFNNILIHDVIYKNQPSKAFFADKPKSSEQDPDMISDNNFTQFDIQGGTSDGLIEHLKESPTIDLQSRNEAINSGTIVSNNTQSADESPNRNVVIMKKNAGMIEQVQGIEFQLKDQGNEENQSLILDLTDLPPPKGGIEEKTKDSFQSNINVKIAHRNEYAEVKVSPLKMVVQGTASPSKKIIEPNSYVKVAKFDESGRKTYQQPMKIQTRKTSSNHPYSIQEVHPSFQISSSLEMEDMVRCNSIIIQSQSSLFSQNQNQINKPPIEVLDALISDRYQQLNAEALKGLNEAIQIAKDVIAENRNSRSITDKDETKSIALTKEPDFLKEESSILLKNKEKELKLEKALIYQHQKKLKNKIDPRSQQMLRRNMSVNARKRYFMKENQQPFANNQEVFASYQNLQIQAPVMPMNVQNKPLSYRSKMESLKILNGHHQETQTISSACKQQESSLPTLIEKKDLISELKNQDLEILQFIKEDKFQKENRKTFPMAQIKEKMSKSQSVFQIEDPKNQIMFMNYVNQKHELKKKKSSKLVLSNSQKHFYPKPDSNFVILGDKVIPQIIKIDHFRKTIQLKNPYEINPSETEKTFLKIHEGSTFGNNETTFKNENRDLTEITKLVPIFKPNSKVNTGTNATKSLNYDSR